MTTSMKIIAATMLLSVAAVAPALAQADTAQKPERLNLGLWAEKSLPASGSSPDNPHKFENNSYEPANRDAGNLVEKTWASRHPDAISGTVPSDPNHLIRTPGPQRADRDA